MACKLNSMNNKIHTSEVLSGCMKYQFPATPLFSQIPPVSSFFYFSFFLSQNLPSYSSQTSLKLLFSFFFSSFPVLSVFLKTSPTSFFFFSFQTPKSPLLSSLEKLFIPSRKWPLPLSHADSSKPPISVFFFPSFDFPFLSY